MTDHRIDHRYTVIEIGRMRVALWEMAFPGGGYISSYGPFIEDSLRTYMMAGIRPEELEEAAKKEKDKAR